MRCVVSALLVLVGLVPATLVAAPVPPYGVVDAGTHLASSYFGARYYASQTGRFTSVDPGHVNGDIFDPQSWNAYAYARNNPLKYTDPTGTTYEICAQGVSQCQQVSDQYFAILQRNPGAGIQLFGGYIYAGGKGAGTYRQTSVDWTFNSFFLQTGRRAEAGVNAALIATSPALALGAGVTVAGALGTGALTSLAIGAAPLTPVVPSALDKLQRIGLSVQQAVQIVASPGSQRFVDTAHGSNINVIQQVGDRLVRITLDPTGQRIISAGYVQGRNVANSVASGRFIPK